MNISRRHINHILSKFSKVTSDEPAYKEKKKTDTGYVWVYDDKHIEKRWKEKKNKLKKLNKSIEKLRKAYEKDLSADDLRTRALAAIVGIMDDTAMRVGNEDSAKEADTYGATTLKVKHLTLGNGKATFKFVGKDNVKQDVFTKNKKIVSVLKELIKGKKDNDFIFEIDGTKIWDRAVNRYLSPFEISAKDIRGFQANKLMEEHLKTKDFKEALDEVAELVGHKASTLKNQYLDPDLVHKYDKKKEASLSIRADNNMSEAPEPVAPGQVPKVDVNKNVANIHPNAQTGMNARLRVGWSIIAPFLPSGARLRSSTRSEMGQRNIIRNYWTSTVWKTSGGQRVPVTVQDGEGFFVKNFPQVASVDASADINSIPVEELEKARQFMTSKYDYRTKVNNNGKEVSVWKLGGPWTKLYIAGGGQSNHVAGKAIDVDSVPLMEIGKAINYIRKEPTLAKHLIIGNVYEETDQDNVHIDILAARPVPKEHLEALLRNFYYNYPLMSIQSQTTSMLSKRALLSEREQQLFDTLKGKLQSPVSVVNTTDARGLKTNELIDEVWGKLAPHVAPLGAKMTSAIRTPEDQIQVIRNYWNMSGASKRYPYVQDPEEMAKALRFMGYTINDPDKTPHSSGRSFDVGGPDIDGIAQKIREVSNSGLVPAKLNVLVEPKNNAVHVDIVRAAETPLLSKHAAKVNMEKQIKDILEDLAQSGAPAEVIEEYKNTFGLVPAIEEKKASLSIRADEKPAVNIPEEQSQNDMGFGKDDMMGDWFEKSPEFRHKEIPEESADLSEADANKLAGDDPEKFFYRGLHKQYPNLEIEALKNMLKSNAKFYFVFKYNEREEAFKALLQSAAEALSQQDARAFFYYYLHQKFPELGRGAIIQIIDTNPDSFFDLGLDKDYPDYVESANNARNIKDPNKVELEQPEWLKNEPDQALSIRDKAAAAAQQAPVYMSDEISSQNKPLSSRDHKELTEEEAVNIINGKHPSAYFTYSNIEPAKALIAAQNVADEEPIVYFMNGFHKHPLYKQFNIVAVSSLINKRPEMYFNMHLFGEEEFKSFLGSAMTSLASKDPKFLLKLIELDKFKDFRNLKDVAEEALKKRSNFIISIRDENFLSKRAKKKKHEKAGVFAVVPKELAKEFPSLGDHDDSKPHVTVLFIGKVPKKQNELLEETIKEVLATQKPFKVKLDEKVSYFPATKHSDGCKIAKLKILSDELHQLNKDLKKAIKKAGIKVDEHFPSYKPHITLEYMPKGQEKYEKYFPKGSFLIEKVEIWNGDHKKKFNFGGKSISKRAGDLAPIAPMKLRKMENPDDILKDHNDSEIWVQQKIDGFKTQAIKDKGGSVKLYTRHGEGFEANVPSLVSELEDKAGPGDFLLGELAYLKNGKQSISDVQTVVSSSPEKAQEKLKDDGELVFYVYDLLWDGGTDITKEPYEERYHKLKKKVGKSKIIQVLDNYSYADKDQAINDALKAGGEGIVLKPKDSEYKYAAKGSNEPVGEWAKHKPAGKKSNKDEVILKDYSKGKEKLIFPMYQHKGDELFEVGQLSGMSKEDEAKIKKDIDAGKQVVVEITFQERMESGKFRHVGWSRFRPDKPAKEVKFSKANLSFVLSKRAADEDGKYEEEKDDPKWDEVLIDSDKKLTRKQIRDHYKTNASKILKEIKGEPVMLYIGTGKNENILKRKHDDKPIVINNEDDLMYWADRRMLSLHRVFEAETDLGFVDLDLHGGYEQSKAKDYAKKVAAKIKSKYHSSPTIYSSGGDGFHIEFKLGKKMKTDTLRNELRELCEELNEGFEGATTGIVKGKGMRTDVTTLKNNGNIRVPYALHESNGGIKKPIGSGGDNGDDGLLLSKRAKDPLSTYKKKRDFNETSEPEGKVENKNKHRFVIQRHKADKAGEHFDLRLENDDGAMSSWAIPKHKLPAGDERLLAQQTEDHPIAYNKFKGEIEEGYGKGHVDIHDGGNYELIKWDKDTIKFKLKGKKEHGSYTLHKTDGKKWMIMVMKDES